MNRELFDALKTLLSELGELSRAAEEITERLHALTLIEEDEFGRVSVPAAELAKIGLRTDRLARELKVDLK